jgi:hypothetical protein
MFGSRFSHARFSLRDAVELETRVSVFFTENIHSMVSSGQITPINAHYRERTGRQVTGTRGVLFSNRFSEGVQSAAGGARDCQLCAAYAENISGDIFLSGNIAVKKHFMDAVNIYANIGKNTMFEQSFAEETGTAVTAALDFPLGVDMRESVFSVTNAGFVDEDTFLIDISIPPNAEIRIDSEYFTVTLGSTNILHRHFGDWINISRDTLEVMVSSDGRIDGQILYMERFL